MVPVAIISTEIQSIMENGSAVVIFATGCGFQGRLGTNMGRVVGRGRGPATAIQKHKPASACTALQII
jgi:hypothetical protein